MLSTVSTTISNCEDSSLEIHVCAAHLLLFAVEKPARKPGLPSLRDANQEVREDDALGCLIVRFRV